MGFMDILRGKKQLRQPTEDRLFAMSTAYIPMDEQGIRTKGKAAIVFQPLGTADFDEIVKDMTEVLQATGDETGTKITTADDTFGYRFMIVEDDDFEDLVVALNAVWSAIRDGGYADRVLVAVFPFADSNGRAVYWLYNVKRAAFYPFVPAPGDQARDNATELQYKARFEKDLPVEQDLSRWFPLWNLPL